MLSKAAFDPFMTAGHVQTSVVRRLPHCAFANRQSEAGQVVAVVCHILALLREAWSSKCGGNFSTRQHAGFVGKYQHGNDAARRRPGQLQIGEDAGFGKMRERDCQ
jgi:hypothetical protein